MADARANIPRKRPMKYPVQYRRYSEDSEMASDKDESGENSEIESPREEPLLLKKRKREAALEENEKEEKGDNNADDDDEDEGSDEDEDDDELSEEEEEEEDEEDGQDTSKSKSRSKKKQKRNIFIEEEAEVDEESDEDEDDGLDEDDDFINEAEDAVKLRPQIYRELDSRRETEQDVDVDAVTRRLKERYGRGEYAEPTEFVGDSANVPMQFLLPTPQDPSLWCIKCRPGREKDIVKSLMRKSFDYQNTEHPLRITAVIARDNLKGYIYIEARSQADVLFAIDKMNNLYVSKLTLVPMEEMVDVLTIKSKSSGLKIGSWVRISRGKYKGDLAQVLSSDNPDKVEIKMIPRLDYAIDREGNKKSKAKLRPAQRFFNPKDVPTSQSISKAQGFWLLNGDRFDKEGFLVKEININSLESSNVNPSLEELSKFSSGNNVEDNIAALELGNDGASESQFAVGDRVVVLEGDLVNAHGVVKQIMKNNVLVEMNDEDLGSIEIEIRKLGRSFIVGDHVKIVRGKYKDETGMITKISGNVVSVFSDLTMAQFSVFAKDLRTAAEVSITENVSDGYALHDLIQMGLDDIGVVIKVEKDQYRVIDQNGTVRTVKSQEITQKRDSRKTLALDVNQNTLHSGDVVDIIIGEFMGKQASILHLYRSFAFLLSKDVTENGGVIVLRTKSIRLSGSKDSKNGAGFSIPAPPSKEQIAFNRNRAQWLHKNVTIIRGPYKGYQGVVKDFTEKGAKVELHTNAKIVTVEPNFIIIKDSTTRTSSATASQDLYSNAKTPMLGSRTPGMYAGSQTPSHFDSSSARTPAWDIGSKTPMHMSGRDVDSFETPAKDWSNFDKTVGKSVSGAYSVAANPIPTLDIGIDWLVKGIEVKFASGNVAGEIGYVSECAPDGKTGTVICKNQTFQVSTINLLPVQPAKKDGCVFIYGQHKGMKGTLIGIDNEDAIVKLSDSTSSSGFTIASISHVSKLHAQ